MLRAIETRYDGYRFRSRLEARWAVFFKFLGIEYEYEKEGYDLGELGWYLPDFWLPDQECWIEIKGAEATDEEMNKLDAVCLGTNSMGYMFAGNIQAPEEGFTQGGHGSGSYGIECAPISFGIDEPPAGCSRDEPYYWCECPTCGHVGIVWWTKYRRLLCTCGKTVGSNSPHRSKRLLGAYSAARSARF